MEEIDQPLQRHEPRPLSWLVDLAGEALVFFSLGSRERNLSALGRPVDASVYNPFSAMEFLLFLEKVGRAATGGNAEAVIQLLAGMSRVGLLQAVGHTSQGMFNQTYVQSAGLPSSRQGGDLWLSELLGPALTIDRYRRVVVAVVGHDENGDEHCGSGLVLGPRHVLTCGHVLTDMTVDGVLPPASDPEADQAVVSVARYFAHNEADVGVVEVEADLDVLPDLVFRPPTWADSVLTFGYPPVALASQTVLTVQSGEVVNPDVLSVFGSHTFLFSAMSQPGNSGGPIVAADGRVLGLVAHDLQRQGEDKAGFFAGVPTQSVHSALASLGLGELLKLETWE